MNIAVFMSYTSFWVFLLVTLYDIYRNIWQRWVSWNIVSVIWNTCAQNYRIAMTSKFTDGALVKIIANHCEDSNIGKFPAVLSSSLSACSGGDISFLFVHCFSCWYLAQQGLRQLGLPAPESSEIAIFCDCNCDCQETTKDPEVEGSRSYQSSDCSVSPLFRVQKPLKYMFYCVSVQSGRGG